MKKKLTQRNKENQQKEIRLASAKLWITSFTGKKIVRAYRNHYQTDLLTAINELRILGVEVSEKYEEAVKQSIRYRTVKKKKHNRKTGVGMLEDEFLYPDFYFVAGFTSGGVPFGLLKEESFESEPVEGADCDLPF